MRKLIVFIAVGLVVGLLGTSAAFGQEEEATPEDVEAAFADLTRSEIEAMGYVVEEMCIDAELAGAPPDLGAMGFHAVNESLVDDVVDPLEPEAIVLDPDDNVVAVEYVAEPNSGLSVFGQDLVFVEPLGHDALHLWFLDNPNGQFADFNPNASCPEVTAPPTTGTGGDLSGGGGFSLPIIAAIAGVVGALLLTGGWSFRRLRAR